ncbi:MAG: hypothetical protein U0223_03260 [Nitrospira sp.]
MASGLFKMINPVVLSNVQENQNVLNHSFTKSQDKSVRESAKYSTEGLVPGWWVQNFNPLWKPLAQWLRRRRHMPLSEFQLITSHIPELTAIEKSIVISAFLAYKNMQP